MPQVSKIAGCLQSALFMRCVWT